MEHIHTSHELPGPVLGEDPRALAAQWRALSRTAGVVAVLTGPFFFLVLYLVGGIRLEAAIIATVVVVIALRGLIDALSRRLIPWPSLFGAEDRLRQEDIALRRRAWFWRTWLRRLAWVAALYGAIVVLSWLGHRWFGEAVSWRSAATALPHWLRRNVLSAGQLGNIAFALLAFPINILLILGPFLIAGIKQISVFEPGDADWQVRLADVRGQDEAKEEVRQIVALWQSGEAFERAGGKRDRGLLFYGPPGTGKTMLAKAIATGFNCPFVSIPGSGFAQTFIGIDTLLVQYLAWRSRRLAAKWGGQCIVFIDEIDAVAARRDALALGGLSKGLVPSSVHDVCFFGPEGAITASGDLVLETRAWRERLFASRAPAPRSSSPAVLARAGEAIRSSVFAGFGGGSGGFQQLLVVMDGVTNPPPLRRLLTNRLNTLLDAAYFVPRRLGPFPLRLPPARPRREELYFVGATNAPFGSLDPAIVRPGRMGRHVWFRTPTKEDRRDILDLYLDRVAHEPDLDTHRRRDELARITNGYSPAAIEQLCSMALTHAHHAGRSRFSWDDAVNALTTLEAGTAQRVEYQPDELLATAIHEAGHAVAAHVYRKDLVSTRLSVRWRGGSLGHHRALQAEERFSHWRSDFAGGLVWTLGAMAAERVIYGENSNGVSGDVEGATAQAAMMVGVWGMGPERPDLGERFATEAEAEAAARRLERRFGAVGAKIMNRASMGPKADSELAGVLQDANKREAAAELLGQAYVKAVWLMEHNRAGLEHIAHVLVERRELFGDEVVELLDSARLEPPQVDPLDEARWPTI